MSLHVITVAGQQKDALGLNVVIKLFMRCGQDAELVQNETSSTTHSNCLLKILLVSS